MPKKYDNLREDFIARARLINDEFFDLCMHGNIPCVQKIISLILGRDDLSITRVETQKEFRGLKRSLRLDIYAVDDKGTIYNIEIQVSDEGANPKRARFHASMLNIYHLDKGQDFDKLPEVYIIFITLNDVLGKGRAVYTINTYIDGTNERFDDEQHIVYVNCAAEDDGSEVWKLIHDMTCVNPDEMLVPELADRVGFFKNTQKGKRKMSQLFREIFADVIDEIREDIRTEEAAKAEAKAAKAEAKAAKAEAKATKVEAKAAKEVAKATKQVAKVAKKLSNAVSKLIKSGVMSLESIAETFDMPLEEVQALADKARR